MKTMRLDDKCKARQCALWLVVAGLTLPGRAGTLTGRFVTPGIGAIGGATLSLALSQAANAPGSYAVAPELTACYTGSDGSVVGAPNPAGAPAGAALGGSGTLPAGSYWVVETYAGPSATETLASPEAAFTLAGAGRLQINAPALQPAGATGYNVYIGTAPGGETKQGGSAFATAYIQATALASGAAPPGSNTTVCSLAFNDTLIPSYTYYTATLSDAEGNVVAGYPQSWYLAGSALDVSNIVPLASNPAVRFPYPVLANPASIAAQSVGSALQMNGFGVLGTANLGPGYYSSFWSGALPAVNTTVAGWTPNVGVQLRRLDTFAQTAGSGGSAGATMTVSDGTSTCTFAGLLAGNGAATSQGNPSGACVFSATVPLTVKLAADDHGVEPQNVSWSIEMTAH